MPSINITANGNSDPIALAEACMHRLRLRGATLDAGMSLAMEYADIGQSNWRPWPVRAGEDPITMNSLYQDILVLGDCQVRAVVTGFGTTSGATLASTPMNVPNATVAQAAAAAAIDQRKVLVEDQEYVFTNEVSNNTDNVTISRPA